MGFVPTLLGSGEAGVDHHRDDHLARAHPANRAGRGPQLRRRRCPLEIFAKSGFNSLPMQVLPSWLLVATTLSVYKPWGMTAYGRRKADTTMAPEAEASMTL